MSVDDLLQCLYRREFAHDLELVRLVSRRALVLESVAALSAGAVNIEPDAERVAVTLVYVVPVGPDTDVAGVGSGGDLGEACLTRKCLESASVVWVGIGGAIANSTRDRVAFGVADAAATLDQVNDADGSHKGNGCEPHL